MESHLPLIHTRVRLVLLAKSWRRPECRGWSSEFEMVGLWSSLRQLVRRRWCEAHPERVHRKSSREAGNLINGALLRNRLKSLDRQLTLLALCPHVKTQEISQRMHRRTYHPRSFLLHFGHVFNFAGAQFQNRCEKWYLGFVDKHLTKVHTESETRYKNAKSLLRSRILSETNRPDNRSYNIWTRKTQTLIRVLAKHTLRQQLRNKIQNKATTYQKGVQALFRWTPPQWMWQWQITMLYLQTSQSADRVCTP